MDCMWISMFASNACIGRSEGSLEGTIIAIILIILSLFWFFVMFKEIWENSKNDNRN